MANKDETVAAGDLIVAMGDSSLSQVIQSFTGGKHSHAALYNGQGVTEATLPRARTLTREQFEKKSLHMSALRHVEMFGPRDAWVIEHASKYVNLTYNNPNLILTGAISTLAAWVHGKNEWLAYNLKHSLSRAKSLLGVLKGLFKADELPSEKAPEGVTCTELVVRSHLLAKLPIEVKLDPAGSLDVGLLWKAIVEVRERSSAPLTTQQSGMSDHEALEALREDLLWAGNMSQQLQQPPGVPDQQAPVAELRALVLPVTDQWDDPDAFYAGLVTPAQLSRSPSFELRGRIQHGSWKLEPDPELEELRRL